MGDEAVLSLRQPTKVEAEPFSSESVHMKLIGANRAVELKGLDELPGRSNYFLGNDPRKWDANVPTFAKVKYHGVYEGIDLVYYGNQQQLEYDFVVAPGADPRAIQFALTTGQSKQEHVSSRAGSLRIDENGDLVIHTATGELRFFKPVVYQPSSARHRHVVEGRFVLKAENRLGFAVGAYDKALVLRIVEERAGFVDLDDLAGIEYVGRTFRGYPRSGQRLSPIEGSQRHAEARRRSSGSRSAARHRRVSGVRRVECHPSRR